MALRSKSAYRGEIFGAFGVLADQKKALTLLRNTAEKPAEIRDGFNQTLLHYAAQNGWVEMCRLLVVLYQVDPDVQSTYGRTALHDACINSHTDTVKYLVNRAHCDPFIENTFGNTPYDYSREESRTFLEGIIEKAQKEGMTIVEYTKSVSSLQHGGNHSGIDYITPNLERAAVQGTAATGLFESLADLSAEVSVDSPSINHPDYGLMLDFDPSSLSDGSPTPITADIRVYADEATIQSCTYPEESKPVSAVYSISLSDTSVPVSTLRIRHCADPSNPEELEQLAFAKTPNSLSTTFEVVLGGIFEPGNHYGVIAPEHMCSWTIVAKAKKLFERPRYIGTVLYQATKNRSNINWLMQLIVAKNDPKCIIALREYISNNFGSDVKLEDEFNFTFRESVAGSPPKMELVPSGAKLNSKNVLRCENGWQIRVDSYEISQDTADQFKTSIDVPGKCKLRINTQKIVPDTFDEPPVFSLTGIDCDRKDIQISPPISDDSNVFETDFTYLEPEIRQSFGPIPTLEAVFGLLKPRSAKWNHIGEQLRVPFNFREGIHWDQSRRPESKLELILNEWIEREWSPVTWDNVMNALEKMGFRNILNIIKEQLSVAPPVDESLCDSDNDDNDFSPITPTSKKQLEQEWPQEEHLSEQLVHDENPLLGDQERSSRCCPCM